MTRDQNDRRAVVVEEVSLCYRVKREHATSIKEAIVRRLLGKQDHEDLFWALQEVSFSVQQGERLGIIGLNGSGKTTLLSLIAGIYKPDKGQVRTQGRVVGLLGLGAGFDPEMTGRENIALNASLYGLSRKEIKAQEESIVAFADIGEFIDLAVKTYSSGMVARLGFAVAAHLHADIVLLDEVMAVGDAQFRQRCLDHLQRLRDENKTVVFVSHDLDSVAEICHLAIWLEKGKVVSLGPAREIVRTYKTKYFPPKVDH